MPVVNPDFATGQDGVAEGWTLTDNCAASLTDNCATEPWPTADGTITGWRAPGVFELGVSDGSEQPFTRTAEDYVRTLSQEESSADFVRVVVPTINVPGDVGGTWTAEIVVDDGAEHILDTVTLDAGRTTPFEGGYDTSAFAKPFARITRLRHAVPPGDFALLTFETAESWPS